MYLDALHLGSTPCMNAMRASRGSILDRPICDWIKDDRSAMLSFPSAREVGCNRGLLSTLLSGIDLRSGSCPLSCRWIAWLTGYLHGFSVNVLIKTNATGTATQEKAGRSALPGHSFILYIIIFIFFLLYFLFLFIFLILLYSFFFFANTRFSKFV